MQTLAQACPALALLISPARASTVLPVEQLILRASRLLSCREVPSPRHQSSCPPSTSTVPGLLSLAAMPTSPHKQAAVRGHRARMRLSQEQEGELTSPAGSMWRTPAHPAPGPAMASSTCMATTQHRSRRRRRHHSRLGSLSSLDAEHKALLQALPALYKSSLGPAQLSLCMLQAQRRGCHHPSCKLSL